MLDSNSRAEIGCCQEKIQRELQQRVADVNLIKFANREIHDPPRRICDTKSLRLLINIGILKPPGD